MTMDYARYDAENRSRPVDAQYAPRPRRHKRLSRAERRRLNMVRSLILYGLPALGLAVGIIVTVFVMNYVHAHETRDYGRELRYSEYTVQAGDTMWDIAADMAALNPEFTDIRQYLSLLQSTNHIYGDYVQSGTVIQVPYYATPSEKLRGGGSLEETMIETYAKYDIIQYDAWFSILGQN